MKIFELFGDIKLNDSGIENKLDQIDKKAKSTGNEFDTLGSKSSKLGGMMQNAFSFFTGQVMFTGFQKIVDGFKSGISMGIEFDSTMEQNKIAFESMLGSADKANDILGKLSKMAASTPFEFPELTNTAKKMLAFGFSAEKIPDMLTKIGDAAAGLGMGADGVDRLTLAIGQMRAKGKIAGGEMMQLTEAGVPAWDILAQAMGKSTAEVMKLSEKGLIPADVAIEQLVDGMEKRFPKMMDKQSKSFKGLMSTLKDNVQMTFGKVLEPTFNNFTTSILPKAIDKVGKFSDAILQGKSPIEALRILISDNFGPKATETFDNVVKGSNDLKDAAIKLEPVVSAIFKYFVDVVVPKLAKFLKDEGPTIKKTFEDLKDILEKLEPVLEDVATFLLDTGISAFRDFFNVVSGTVGALKDLSNLDFSGFVQRIKDMLPSLADLSGTLNAISHPISTIESFILNSVFKGNRNEPNTTSTEGFKGHYATGTSYAYGGWSMVGERGPELIKLNGGEKVLNNNDTNKVLGQNNQPAILNLVINGRNFASAIINDLNAVQGQDIQLAYRGGGLK